MKLKLYHILILLGVFLASTQLRAQDNQDMMEQPEVKSSFMPGGESHKYETRDSIYLRPAVQQKTSADPTNKNAGNTHGTKDEDDTVLSFNFLYYIIQKFKMSDIVDP